MEDVNDPHPQENDDHIMEDVNEPQPHENTDILMEESPRVKHENIDTSNSEEVKLDSLI